MGKYKLTWITDNLAAGYAPMSYEELEEIKAQGISAILNLCGEYCDLHEIEEKYGFEVYYLPIPDEHAPDMEAMEKALEWLDENLYLGKKVLVHCKHGIGRTGTFLSAYFIRKGMGLKVAEKTLKQITRAAPTSFSQWRLLKKYGKQEKALTIRKPSLTRPQLFDYTNFFNEYNAIVNYVEDQLKAARGEKDIERCGVDSSVCCHTSFAVMLLEAVYINNKLNKVFTSTLRKQVIKQAVAAAKLLAGPDKGKYQCPVLENNRCLIAGFQPLRCRCYGSGKEVVDMASVEERLFDLSRIMFFVLAGGFLKPHELQFSFPDVISGRFLQHFFQASLKASGNTSYNPSASTSPSGKLSP